MFCRFIKIRRRRVRIGWKDGSYGVGSGIGGFREFGVGGSGVGSRVVGGVVGSWVEGSGRVTGIEAVEEG